MTSERNQAIDWLRGLVMIVMALDHSRTFVGSEVDMHSAGPALYATRWITHFCAPVFVLLAGMAAYLHGRQLGTTRALSRYLLTRGVWLAVLEVTLVRLVWIFYVGPEILVLQVIWAIGASMVVLAGLVWLPRGAIAAFALGLVAGHNLLDGVEADQLGGLRWLWLLLHEFGRLEPFSGARWFVVYPLIPWVGVMAAGYVIGPWAALPRVERRARFLRVGVGVTAGFVLLRAANLYGDPLPWSLDGGWLRALLSFLDCEKYPPSLLYLAMTLGPALCLLAAMDRPLGPWAARVAIYGRVPLFYYVLHLLFIHLGAIALAWPMLGVAAVAHPFAAGEPLGYSLWAVYGLWIAVVLALYPLCRWFAEVKRRSDSPWLSYL
ncbi:MAG: heparan-alpha-glucosaminide N-acetyltransferase domain-containing protein [Deltaproteobacteria bacterium]|nr:heparan-alpha-glucosaminide N-acetyltransferase domain-containing protein [Deltaproteobacteria bacterium]